MLLIDTHTHLYDEQFAADRESVVERAREAGVGILLSPAIDRESYEAMFDFTRRYPGCYAMMGLHPTSVNDNPHWQEDLAEVERYLTAPPRGIRFVGVGEIGLDFYWSRESVSEQLEALRVQIEWALRYDLPVVLHTREAWDEMCDLLESYRGRGLRGILHSFSGTADHYERMKRLGGFLFGVGGPVTYKKSAIAALLPRMELSELVLETDAPYLPPVPHRGQRNESAYLPLIARRVAELKGVETEEVAETTSRQAAALFGLTLP